MEERLEIEDIAEIVDMFEIVDSVDIVESLFNLLRSEAEDDFLLLLEDLRCIGSSSSILFLDSLKIGKKISFSSSLHASPAVSNEECGPLNFSGLREWSLSFPFLYV